MTHGKTFQMDSVRWCERWQPCSDWFSERSTRKWMWDMDENPIETKVTPRARKKGRSKRLDAVGWGLFFIWVGVSLLMDLDWGVGLIGVAAIIFLGQAARNYYDLKLEKSWVVVGVLFLLSGIWELYQFQFGLLPILLIVAGGALLISVYRGR